MAICQELEAAGVAAGCHDTSKTACKYARERVTFYAPGSDKKVGGQVLRFVSPAQYDTMLKIASLPKSGSVVEGKPALTLVQLLGDSPELAAKTKAIVEKLPAVPSDGPAPDPTCAK